MGKLDSDAWPGWSRRGVILAAVLAVGSVLIVAAQGAPGALDPTFGADGMVTVEFGGGSEIGVAVAVQPDGKIVAAGTKSAFSSQYADYALARFESDGALDTSFGNAGKVVTDLSGWRDWGSAVAIQPDGKIIMAGTAYEIGTGRELFGLVRYEPDGTLDTTFGVDGVVRTSFGWRTDEGRAVALQSDGKIVVAGMAGSFWSYHFGLARYRGDGSLDTTFGSGGLVSTTLGNTGSAVAAIAIQPDGKIVAAGHVQTRDYEADFGLARYHPDGALDVDFGDGGTIITEFGDDDHGRGVAVQPDGKIMVVGYSGFWPTTDIALARYDRDGHLDATFGNGGKVITDLGGNYQSGNALVIQSDGKIVVVGDDANPDGTDAVVARYTVSGTLDAGFGLGGVATNARFLSAQAVALQRDGKIVIIGYTYQDEMDVFAVGRHDTRVTGSASVGDSLTPIGDTDVKARFSAGGPCTVQVTKTIAFPIDSPRPGKMPVHWEVSAGCIGAYRADLVFCYTDAELYNSVGATEDHLVAFKRMGTWRWVDQGGAVDADANCVTLTDVVLPGFWVLGTPPREAFLPLVAQH